MQRIKLSLFAASLLVYAAASYANPKQVTNPNAAVVAPTFQFCIMEGVGKQQNQGEAEAMWEPLQQVVNKTLGAKTRFNLYQNWGFGFSGGRRTWKQPSRQITLRIFWCTTPIF